MNEQQMKFLSDFDALVKASGLSVCEVTQNVVEQLIRMQIAQFDGDPGAMIHFVQHVDHAWGVIMNEMNVDKKEMQ